MSILTDIESKLSAFADEAIAAAKAELAAELPVVEAVVEDGFVKLVELLGSDAATIVLRLFGADGAGLSGSEKANLAVTTLVQTAEKKGVAIVAADGTALIKNAFLVVKSKLAAPAPATGG